MYSLERGEWTELETDDLKEFIQSTRNCEPFYSSGINEGNWIYVAARSNLGPVNTNNFLITSDKDRMTVVLISAFLQISWPKIYR